MDVIINKDAIQVRSKMEIKTDYSYTIRRLLDDLHDGMISDYVLQRDKGQYPLTAKSALIDTILQDMNIPDIVIVQKGTGYYAEKFLVDGGQRCSIIDEYVNDGFALRKCSDVRPVYIKEAIMVPQLDENGEPVMKKIAGKRKAEPVMVQKKDEEGNSLFQYVLYNPQGKKFSDLPKELKKRILDYNRMGVKSLVNCTDEETRIQLKRYNMGFKMNVVQIGEITSGEKLATYKRKRRNHELFKNQSTWTANEIKKDAIERCVTESFVLINCPELWIGSNYDKVVNAFCDYATEEALKDYKELLNELSVAITGKDLEEQLNNKTMFLVIPLFHTYLEKGYNVKLFGDFLVEWFDSIKDTTNYSEFDEKSTKNKANIVARLAIMEEAIDNFAEEHKDEIYAEEDEDIEETTEEYDSSDEEFAEDSDVLNKTDDEENDTENNTALKYLDLWKNPLVKKLIDEMDDEEKRQAKLKLVMMASSNSGFNFDEVEIKKFVDKFRYLPDGSKQDMIENADFLLECLGTYISKVADGVDNDFFSIENILCLLNLIQFSDRENVPDSVFIEWLKDLIDNLDTNDTWNSLPNVDEEGCIMSRISYMQQSLMKYYASKLV